MSGPARTGPAVVALQARTAVVLTAAVGAVATLVAGLVEGGDGLWSGVLGTLAVLGFFVAGLTPVLRSGMLERGGGSGMVVVLVGYVVRLLAVILVVSVVVAVADLHRGSLGLTVVACSLAWVLGTAVVALRGHVPLDLPDYDTAAPRAEEAAAPRAHEAAAPVVTDAPDRT